ncbi:hypothetical protein ACNHUS_00745 [Actinomycetes bacterium M1A6_2h]
MPGPIRWAGILVALEGLAAVGVAVVLLVRSLPGHEQGAANGYGTALWFLVLGGGVATGGVALALGRRWARAIAVVAQLLLLPVVWSLLTDSHQLLWGSLLGVVVVATLVLLFSPPASRWLARDYIATDDADAPD